MSEDQKTEESTSSTEKGASGKIIAYISETLKTIPFIN